MYSEDKVLMSEKHLCVTLITPQPSVPYKTGQDQGTGA